MEYLMVLLLVSSIAVYFNIKDSSSNKEVNQLYADIRRENCGLHRWVTHPESERLVCERCGFIAGV